MRNSLLNWKYEKLAGKLIENFAKRSIEAVYLPSREQVVPRLVELIPAGSTVASGGSLTLQETGARDLLKSGSYNYLDREAVSDSGEREEILRKALWADFYLCSANAITLDGQILLLDGNCNRVAAVLFGPKRVILVVGMNKVVGDIDSAIERIKFIAPMNAKRLNLHTPCTATGFCMDCTSDERICGTYVTVSDSSRRKGRYTVMLVGEELGL
ncbi:MAG TPA: lactate utilization protein [Mesotoga infera]|jgi:hypothetical protein|nr:lactate utilization protein [Mesotoga sp.]NLI05492.1 lactate utilization protein [Thermotogaceae bacterium]HNR78674.1 lactate utilization protein [Mesotoga infera]HOI34846.1 lactate utilization protein [Mesotoga infera]HON28268.1 lactate utilization protein [Mesotoga infera]